MSDHTHHEHRDDLAGDEAHACSARPSALLVELREHVPFSVAAVAIGLIVAGAICVIGFSGTAPDGSADAGATERIAATGAGHEGHDHADGYADDDGDDHGPAMLFFHLFHPAHMLFSGMATAAMFCRYERRWFKAMLVGLVGAIGVCGLSDIAFPHLSLLVLNEAMPWHICVLEHPDMALPFAVVGVLVGIGAAGGVHRSTVISHTLHVFVSTMASIFYMVTALGMLAWIPNIGKVFLFVVIAVMVPCCLSDIVFPLVMSRRGRANYENDAHAHTH